MTELNNCFRQLEASLNASINISEDSESAEKVVGVLLERLSTLEDVQTSSLKLLTALEPRLADTEQLFRTWLVELARYRQEAAAAKEEYRFMKHQYQELALEAKMLREVLSG